MRKQLRDMEAKVKDQEEELDEQAGNIQMLEQVLSSIISANPCTPGPNYSTVQAICTILTGAFISADVLIILASSV